MLQMTQIFDERIYNQRDIDNVFSIVLKIQNTYDIQCREMSFKTKGNEIFIIPFPILSFCSSK